MSGNRYGRYIAKFTIDAEVVKDETRNEKLTPHITDMTVQQWTTLAGQLRTNIAEVIKAAKQHLDQHQGDEFEKDHWGFWNLRRAKVEEWEETLRQKSQQTIEKTFPGVKSPPVYLTCAVVSLLDGEEFTYTIWWRKAGAPGVSVSHELHWKVDMDPVVSVQKSEADKDSSRGSVPDTSQFTADVSEHTANMNERGDRSGFSCPETGDTQSVPPRRKIPSNDQAYNRALYQKRGR
ncbi:hypothetical protein FFLO_03469 [Filobasidium floriforme]|uniref:Uncharacterized protein n=1 Tax=Filobasidium floriforme TaxID=5210 RepID=A0A8K0JKM5_9TREE|nr:hypothetical protein FFLO_03469 [Filobasidium floriforme]